MKAKDIRALAADAKETELTGLLREQFNLRMQKGSGQLTQTHQFGRVRREIAQVKTVLGSKK